MRILSAEVVVVGAGPAGCSAAITLARRGVDVLVLERESFPRDKVCGDGLAPRGVGALRDLGLESEIQSRGYRPIREYRLVSTWGDSVAAGVPSFGKGAPYTYVVPRMELDALLVETARSAGARVEERMRVAGAVPGAAGYPEFTARTAGGEDVLCRAPYAVMADGARGPASRKLVGGAPLTPGAVAMRAYVEGAEGHEGHLNFFLDESLLPGYGWIFPGGRPGAPANVGVGMTTKALKARGGGLRPLFEWFMGPESSAWVHLRNARLVSDPRPFPLQVTFWRGVRRRGRVLFAGDSANLVDPLSGEGIAYALESGRMAAEAVLRARAKGSLGSLSRYEADVWRGLGSEFMAAWVLREFLRRPWGNGAAIRAMCCDDGLARGGMGLLSNRVPATWLLRPSVWGRVLSPKRVARVLRSGTRSRR